MSLFLVVAPLGFTFSTEGRAQGYEDTGKHSPSDHTANPSFLLLSIFYQHNTNLSQRANEARKGNI